MNKPWDPFTPGTLWSRIVHRSKEAHALGAIQSIDTVPELVEEGGIRFVVRVLAHLAHKPQPEQGMPSRDPFLPPYDPRLFVSDVSPTHVCLLNKFNVVDHHLLIVTRDFEAQESILTLADFNAWLACSNEYAGLGFYNGGIHAGASQPHKHLQVVPLPLAPSGPSIPIAPLVMASQSGDGFATLPSFPFSHLLAHLNPEETNPSEEGAERIWGCYIRMLDAAGLLDTPTPRDGLRIPPYNLLLTKQWMLLVPRVAECFGSISVNALGFAGAFLVKNARELQILKERGPLEALRQVSVH